MRIIFAGTPTTAVEPLEELNEVAEIVTVFTKPDAPCGRKQVLTSSPVRVRAEELKLDVVTPGNAAHSNIKSDILAQIQKLESAGRAPDLGVAVAYGEILSHEVLDALPLGWLNLHYSLLPKWRGAAPVQHAILNGETTTGVTVFRIAEQLDEGPILLQEQFKIEHEMTTGELLCALSTLGSKLLKKTLRLLETAHEDNNLQKIEDLYTQQPKLTELAYAAKLAKEDARIDWNRPATEVVRKINAFSPNPGAWFNLVQMNKENKSLPKVTRVVALKARVKPGETAHEVELLEVKPAGKTAMSATSWMRGLRGEWYLK